MRKRKGSMAASAALALILMTGTSPASAQPAERFQFDLPAEPLAEALRDIALRTGRSIIAPDELVRTRQAPALSGMLTVEQAVGRLLEGTDLVVRPVDETLVIERSPAGDAPGATGSKEAGEPAIVVTGTHVRGAAPTSPVITLTRRQIDEAAPASVEELMRRVPQNVSAGVSQENFAVEGTGADITDHGAGINLRGLGQRATLVLVDGRRIAPGGTGSFVDVSLIPVSALERVEILTDGASAIYGSDAVGGVVNFILRDDVRGIEPMLQVGTSTRGGGEQVLAGLSAGTDWRGGRGLLSYEFRGEGEIRASQRDFTIGLPDSWALLPRERRHSLYGTARQDLSGMLTLALSGLYSRRTTDRSFFNTGDVDPLDAHAVAREYGGTAALTMQLGPWRGEAAGTYYSSRRRELTTQDDDLFNRFASVNNVGELGLKADGPLFTLPAGEAKVAVGAALRRERFSSVFETQVNPPNPQSGSRTVSSLHAEMILPLFSEENRRPGFEKLMLTAAGRLEHYQRLGSSFNPKLGALWSPLAGLEFRSTYSTSFRAPLLYETLGLYNVFLLPAAILYVDPSQAQPGVAAALAGANPDVKPERSRSFSAGVDLRPRKVPGLRLSATYYAIRFTNRIALPTEQIVVVGNPALEPIVTRNPSLDLVTGLLDGAGQVVDASGPGFSNGNAQPGDVVLIVDARNANTAETRTSGLDLGISYDFELGASAFRSELNLNKVFRFDDRLTRTSPVAHTLDTPFHPVSWRARAGVSWTGGPLSGVLFVNYTGDYRDDRAPVSRPVRSWTTVDAGLAYTLSPAAGPVLGKLRLALNVQNLFDRDPPQLAPEPGFSRGVGYDTVNASGRGRTLSVQIRRRW
jgi:iron complex outermembrane receptor protein